MNAQASRAFLPVDKDAVLHHCSRFDPLPLRQTRDFDCRAALSERCQIAGRRERSERIAGWRLKKPSGLRPRPEALLGPRVKDAGDGRASPRRARLALCSSGNFQPGSTSRERAWTKARSTSSPGKHQGARDHAAGLGASGGDADGGHSTAGDSAHAELPRYEVIAGERRVRAAKLAGLSEVPVLVRDAPDEAAAAMSLIENIQREDLNPLEEAQGLKRLTDEFGLTHEAAAQSVGRSRSAASNLLRLLNLT